MTYKLKAVYENGVLKPLKSLKVPEKQVLNITLEWNGHETDAKKEAPKIVRLQGVLKDHLLGDIKSDLTAIRKQALAHLDAESVDE